MFLYNIDWCNFNSTYRFLGVASYFLFFFFFFFGWGGGGGGGGGGVTLRWRVLYRHVSNMANCERYEWVWYHREHCSTLRQLHQSCQGSMAKCQGNSHGCYTDYKPSMGWFPLQTHRSASGISTLRGVVRWKVHELGALFRHDNTMSPIQNGRHCPDDILKWIFF